MPSRTGPPTVSGRWSLLPDRHGVPAAAVDRPRRRRRGGPGVLGGPAAATMRAHALALTLLERHGVLTRGAVAAERVPGGFAAVYPVLRAMEETGQCRRGYFVEGLGAAQFALPGAVDRMRAMAGDLVAGGTGDAGRSADAGGPDRPTATGRRPRRQRRGRFRPARPDRGARRGRPGPALRGGPAVAAAPGGDRHLAPARPQGGRGRGAVRGRAGALRRAGRQDAAVLDRRPGRAGAVRARARRRRPRRALGRITVEKADGGAVHDSPLAAALSAAGFRATPRGLRLRG